MSGAFTLDEYQSLLELALESGYSFRSFGDEAEEGILLRHDIDYGPVFMTEMAALEADLGVRATYCVQLDSPWYSLDDPESHDAVRAALDSGHWLGLHVDANELGDETAVRTRVVELAAELGHRYRTVVRAVSFHMPGRRPLGHLDLPEGLVNTYAPKFFGEIAYVSDSNQSWRGADLRGILRERSHERLQLLIHPFWWRREATSLRAKMSELADRLGIRMEEIVTREQWTEIEAQEARR